MREPFPQATTFTVYGWSAIYYINEFSYAIVEENYTLSLSFGLFTEEEYKWVMHKE